MFSRSYLGGTGSSSGKPKTPVVYFDIRVDSPYKDIIILQGSPLETEPYPLSGKLVFSLSDDVIAKRVSLKFTGTFKLEFMQFGKFKNEGKLVSVIKEKKVIFEAKWDNLLVSPQGTITIGSQGRHNEMYNSSNNHNNGANVNIGNNVDLNVDLSHNSTDTARNVNSKENNSQTLKKTSSGSVLTKLIKKNSFYGSNILELPINGSNGTPYEHMMNDFNSIPSSTQVQFQLQRGNYELPFKVMLPREIPETIEGLQSASILYNFEAHIERSKRPKGLTSIMRDDSENSLNQNLSLAMTGSSTNMAFYSFKCFRYMRIYRTLSFDNLAIQEEMKVGNTWADKLQYEVSITSRAIPVGGYTPITIKIFPFQKNYKLEKISATLVQFYSMKDSSNTFYDDSVNTLKQSMTDFDGFVTINERTGTLIEKVEINSMIKIPDDLKKITQDCDIINDLVQVRHKLTIQIFMKRIDENGEQKSLEIKANLPVLLYISPQFGIKGRYVVLDKIEGNIHFRSGKFVNIFNTDSANNFNSMIAAAVNNTNPLFVDNNAPPNYQDRTKDQIVHYNSVDQTQLETPAAIQGSKPDNEVPTTNHNNIIPMNTVPTYEQTMNETTINANTGSKIITTTTTTSTTTTTTTTTTISDPPSSSNEEDPSPSTTTTRTQNRTIILDSNEMAPGYY